MSLILAKDKDLCSTSPSINMSRALNGWLQKISLVVLGNEIVNSRVELVETDVETMGIFQPLEDDEIEQYPEGQRDWAWYSLISLPNLFAKINDRIIYNNLKYKIMSRKDWRANGYMYYTLIEDFE